MVDVSVPHFTKTTTEGSRTRLQDITEWLIEDTDTFA